MTALCALANHARRSEHYRWAGSLGAVLVAHGALLSLAWSRWETTEIPYGSPVALLLELAPLPSPPEAAAAESSLEPPPSADTLPPIPEPELMPISVPVALPMATLDTPPPAAPAISVSPPEPGPTEPSAPIPAAAAPPAADAPAAPLGSSSISHSNALPAWHDLVLAHLQRHKRYPREARSRRQQGVAYLRFTIDRSGRVLSHTLTQSAGIPVLDEETIALIERAEPLPPPPPEVTGDTIVLVVPVEFSIRQ